MRQAIETRIDADLCTGCKLCVEVCPTMALQMRGDKAVVIGEHSLGCGHCAAICPAAAITVGSIDDRPTDLQTVDLGGKDFVAPGKADVKALVRLMASRRSCRLYKDQTVPREVLEDLVRIGQLAPSGTNAQTWTFSVLPDRAAVVKLAEGVGDFFRLVNRVAEHPIPRLLSRATPMDPIGMYHREYHDLVTEGMRQWEEQGRDRLMHGAPAAILIGARKGISTPREDALLASQNILLAAHAMGLGTCLIGFAVEAMKIDRRIKKRLGLPRGEKIYSVIALGYPKVKYQRATGRRAVKTRFL